MELPHIGLRCISRECKQLDFLPIKCDACNGIFCAEHYKYSQHNCAEARERNNLVPVCEKCQTLVPPKNFSADEAMKLHLLNHCSPYKKERIYTNRCNKNDCKRKELIPFRCDSCQMSYCIKHRHTYDHDCRAKAASQTMMSQLCAKAAETRKESTTKKETKTTPATTCGAQQRAQRAGAESVRTTNANLSEEEALALALSQSESEAKKREEEIQNRVVDAAAS